MFTRREFIVSAAALAGCKGNVGRKLLVSVLTCPRPGGVSYLEGTLAAVDAELANRTRLLICDGVEVLRDGWTSAVVPPRAKTVRALPDNKAPGWVAISTALSMDHDLLFLEDDIRPLSPGAFTSMASHRVAKGCAFTTFFHRNRTPGVYDAASFNMSQAVLLPLKTVRHLWENGDDPGLSNVIGVDLAIAMIGRGARWKFEQTEPLVQHVGEVSAALPGQLWNPRRRDGAF